MFTLSKNNFLKASMNPCGMHSALEYGFPKAFSFSHVKALNIYVCVCVSLSPYICIHNISIYINQNKIWCMPELEMWR